MFRKFILIFLLLSSLAVHARKIPVKDITELNTANKQAQPGDSIILKNGEWNNVTIQLSCEGTIEKPIVFMAQTEGKVLITGKSQLKLGGTYIIVNGLYFTNGYAGDNAVISFRISKDKLANNCRVTNCVINDFNNPRRMDENNWVLFYGKRNRLDHSSFKDKKNMGVLLAVILDDERSRENYHSIDHNYFGRRPPLGSNGGEIIRVGVSQHCEFNSFTGIVDNFFEHCDGETEIISIKSGTNIVTDNLFKECQGSVVLRHGDNNIVAGNIFIGNDKPGTGGVRIINKGQKVAENFFYKCRGTGFRSPMAIMNGIPNSPAHRYVQVTEAEIFNNCFFECAPLSFGEGSDAERTLAPERVEFARNSFFNTRDSIIYRTWDKISGFNFHENKVSSVVTQPLPSGFEKVKLSRQELSKTATGSSPSFTNVDDLPKMEKAAYAYLGAPWFPKKIIQKVVKPITVNCSNAEQVYAQLENKKPVHIRLTGNSYTVDKPFVINKTVLFTSSGQSVKLKSKNIDAIFLLAADAHLTLDKLTLDGQEVNAKHFIASDSMGYSAHYNLVMKNTSLMLFARESGCESIFYASKDMIADSIVFRNNQFRNNSTNGIMMVAQQENKGYYNAEKIIIGHNRFNNLTGTLLSIYRGGNDESTLGPNLLFSHNKIDYSTTPGEEPSIQLTGVQQTNIFSNQFMGSNKDKILIRFIDIVRATHNFEKNSIVGSGSIVPNQFVIQKNNIIR